MVVTTGWTRCPWHRYVQNPSESLQPYCFTVAFTVAFALLETAVASAMFMDLEGSRANRFFCRSSLPLSTIPWSSFSPFTIAMAAPFTLAGTLVWTSSSGAWPFPRLYSLLATDGSGTGSLSYSTSMASCHATIGTSGATSATHSFTPWGRWRLQPMYS